MKTDPNKPAYPIVHPDEDVIIGLTIREHFAAMAMQGICVNAGRNNVSLNKPDELVQEAICIADALIRSLNEK